MSPSNYTAPAPASHRPPPPALLLAGLLLLASGCAAIRPDPPRGAADGLRAAARESKKDEDQKQRVLTVDPPRPQVQVAATEVEFVSCDYATDNENPPPPAGPRPRFLQGWDLGFVTGGEISGGSMLAPGGDFGLQVGRELGPGTRADLGLMVGPRRFNAGSGFAGAFDTPDEVAADLSIRHTLTHNGRSTGIAPLVGVQFGSLAWNYHHGLLADDGSGPRLVQEDFLDSYSPYAGIVMTLLDSPRVRLDMVAKGGARFYDTHTWEGFRNDAFRTTGFLQVQIETHFPF